MNRKFLEELELGKDVIDKIMTENGNDINNAKKKLEAERDNYKSQLETAQTALKEFDGVDIKDLNGKITQLTNELAAKETEYQTKLSDMEFSSALEAAITECKAKNATAVKALLDIETLKASKNQSEDIKTALEKVRTENDYLFDSGISQTTGVSTPNNKEEFTDDETLRKAMGLPASSENKNGGNN